MLFQFFFLAKLVLCFKFIIYSLSIISRHEKTFPRKFAQTPLTHLHLPNSQLSSLASQRAITPPPREQGCTYKSKMPQSRRHSRPFFTGRAADDLFRMPRVIQKRALLRSALETKIPFMGFRPQAKSKGFRRRSRRG